MFIRNCSFPWLRYNQDTGYWVLIAVAVKGDLNIQNLFTSQLTFIISLQSLIAS